jgi:hypothetical protein
MHFAAEDYGRHELMNWGLCRFAPQSGTTPKATTPYTSDSARPRFVVTGLLACDQPFASVDPILVDAPSQCFVTYHDGRRRQGTDKVFNT